MDESSSSSSSAFPPPAAPPPQSSSSSSTSSATTAAATSSITPMAASSSTPSGGGGGVIMAVPYALSPQPSASSPHTPTSTPSSSSSNSAVQSAAGPSGRAAPTRNKRQELSFAERIDVIMARKSGKSMRQLAVQFGCGKTQILNILGQREAYLREWDEKQAESNPHISSRKRRSRRTGNEETNRLVWEWYTAQREQGIRVTGPMLQREARSIARGLGISNFAASNGWLDSFRRLHNIGPQSRALQQQQQQQQQQQSRIAQTSGQLYAPFGNSGSIQNHPHQHPQDPSIPTISAAYSLDPDTYGHHHQSTDAVSPAASSSTGSSSHLGHHPHGVLPPPPPLEAFGSDVYHQPEYYVEEDEEDEAEYYRRREYQSPEVPRMHPQQQHQHITSTVSLDDCRTSTSGFLGSESSAFSPYRSISSQSTDLCWDDPDGFRYNQFTELYPSSMMQQPQQQQQQQNHHQQQPGVQQVSGLSPRLLIHQGSINERVHHDERSNLFAIGQPMVHHQQQQQQHQVHQPMVRRSVLVSTRAAAAALESQLHNQQQQHDAVQQSADPPADEKRRTFAAASSSESSSSGLELLSASSGAFGQLTSMARQRNLAYFQYADDHGDVWLEIRPPPTSSFRVPLYGYRTHLMRLLVDRHLTYWLEAIGHCVRNGTLRSPSASNELSTNQIEQVLDLLAGGAVVCQGRGSVLKRVHQFHPKAAIEQGIAGSNYFTLPDYRYRAYDCARLVDARSGSNQCAACLRPPEPPPPPPLEVISPPGPQVTDSPMDAVQEQEERGESKRPSDAEPLNLSVHPPVMGVLRFPSPQAFSNFAPAFESGALLRGGADQARGGTAESNVDDYRLAQEAAYLSIHAHPRERSVSAEGCEWTATAPIRASSAGSNGGDYQQRRARSDSPIQQQHHLEAGRGDSKGASPAFDPEFHTTWVKQETIDSPQSNGS